MTRQIFSGLTYLFSSLVCLTSSSTFAAPSASVASNLVAVQALVKTVESEVLKNRPARQRNENDPQPIQALDAKAYPSMESIAAILMKEKNFDRGIALLVVRAVEDLSTMDPSETGALLVGDLRKKPAMVALIAECRSPKTLEKPEAVELVKDQDAVTSAGLLPVKMKELCDFRALMKDLDHLEKNGNG